MKKEQIIRAFQASDKEALIKILKANTPKYFDPNEIDDFEAYIDQRASTYLCVEQDGQIIGGAGYYVNNIDLSGRIKWVFFKPEFHKQGLGKLIIEHCIKELESHKLVRNLMLTTSQLAYPFFEKFGFKTTQTKKDYWGPGLDFYLMEKKVK
jgi:ribosomal protein S18 acetylase RimI-like enzyme